MSGPRSKFDRNAIKTLRQSIRDGVAEVAVQTQGTAKRVVNSEGKGRWYHDQPQPSSRPLDPPAKQTGHLGRSIQVDLSGLDGQRSVTAAVGTNVRYGRYLEFGTSNMAPRPWMRRTIVKMKKKIPSIIKRHMDKAFRQIGVK